MTRWKLVSADSHMSEVAETWDLVQKEYGEKAPRVVWGAGEDLPGPYLYLPGWGSGRDGGGDYESCAMEYIGLFMGGINGFAKRGGFTGPKAAEFRKTFRFEDFPGPWDPEARRKDLDRDGVEFELLYASHLRHVYEVSAKDEPLFHSICRSYNEWILDFASFDPKRFIPLPALSPLSPEGAAQDIRDYVKRGAKGFMTASAVPIGMNYGDPMFDPIWAAAQEADVPIGMHIHSGRWKHPTYHHRRANAMHAEIQTTLGEMIDGGVFQRFPRLKIVSAEYDIGWVAYWVDQIRIRSADPKIAECFDRNIWFTFQDDAVGCAMIPYYGADRFMWANDYPHSITTWPDSQAIVDRVLDGFSDEVKLKVTRQNAIDLYKLDG